MAEVFTVSRKMRFADCDPAGIAFFPRLLEHMNGVVEDWFAGPLDHSFQEMHGKRDSGIPTVTIKVDFMRPAELGDIIEWRLSVEALNRSSLTLSVQARRPDGEEVLQARQTIVHTDFRQDPPKSAPFPEELRKRIENYQDPQ